MHRAQVAETVRTVAAEDARREAVDEVTSVPGHDLGNLIKPLKDLLDSLRRRLAGAGSQRELEHVPESNQW